MSEGAHTGLTKGGGAWMLWFRRRDRSFEVGGREKVGRIAGRSD